MANGESSVWREAAALLAFAGSADPGEIAATDERNANVTGRTIGLTTGQAARYCLVSPDTMANWIKAKQLPAQRTIGGQFRILVDDLREFMVRNAMSTALLDAETDCRSYCWERQPAVRGRVRDPVATCRECPVYRTKALDCFALRAISPDRNWSRTNCRDCAYYQKWAGRRSDECNP